MSAPTVFTEVCPHGCGRRRRAPQAKPSVITYSALIGAAGWGGRWQDVLRLLGAMEAASVQPNSFTCSSAVATLGHSGRWREALAVFDRAGRSGLRRDEDCFAAAARVLSRAAQRRIALAIAAEARGAGGPRPTGRSPQAVRGVAVPQARPRGAQGDGPIPPPPGKKRPLALVRCSLRARLAKGGRVSNAPVAKYGLAQPMLDLRWVVSQSACLFNGAIGM